jgi:Ca-activated chloride channel family protein
VVYAVERSVAQSLGWLGPDGRPVAMDAAKWRAAAESGKLNFAMTSATRSNSGAMAYLGFLQEYAGHPDVLTAAIVQDADVTEKVRRLLKSAHRSSGSSGWLKDLYLDDLERGGHPFNGMINYESIVIELNQELAKRNHEPFVVFYPQDALALANSPLGYVDKGDAARAAAFQKLQDYLLSPAVQAQIEKQGRRRADQTGLKVLQPDPAVWNPQWGIDPVRILSPFTLPEASVIRLALEQYQTSLRKPSLTVYVLDYSGSMGSNGGYEQLKQGMELLLNTDMARQNMLMPGTKDIKLVIPFNSDVLNKGEFNEWTVRGNGPKELAALLNRIRTLEPGDGTNMYTGVAAAFEQIERIGKDLSGFHTEIIVMSDGRSTDARDWMMNEPGVRALGSDIPVFTITFGDADPAQMEALAKAFHGRKFDGTKNLVLSLQEAQGYNQ